MKIKFIIPACLFLFATACKQSKPTASDEPVAVASDSLYGIVVADTIIYDVNITNPNPDDTWAEQCLRGLDHNLLISNIFNMVYSGKALAYNHQTNEKLTPKQVEEIEAGADYSRDNIGMIQFTEVWFVNPGDANMTKKVISMVLGYNYGAPDGMMLHKALFRVEM
jgi:hypothetical protein